jgi:alkylation response protein AidB-like acyl-CoA dehydrogenase
MNGVAPIDLNSWQQELIARARTLAQSKFAGRAAEYDRSADFPAEDFTDLFESGLLSAVVPQDYGGLAQPMASDRIREPFL